MLVQKLPNTKRQINNSFEFFELNATKASCRVNDTCRPLEADNKVDPPKLSLLQRFLRIVCPFEVHHQRPQTLFKSFEYLSINSLCQNLNDFVYWILR
jgi:hypothetical protein